MKLPVQRSRSALTFNMTPLIDIVFLLIIFFLVASHFVKSESSQAVELPIATEGTFDLNDQPYRLTVTIDRDGDYFIADQQLPSQDVFQRITRLAQEATESNQQPQVRIRADRAGTHGPFRKLYEHCANAGIRSIQFAVSDAQKS